MKLITYDNFELKVADEAFLIRPIRELFEADKSKKKENFFRQISYMYFMIDPRSTYQYITDKDERAAEIKRQEGFEDDWQPSQKLRNAMDIYAAHVVSSQSLLIEDTRLCIDRVRGFLRDVDLSSKDKNGKPVYQISSITNAIRQIPELAKALSDAERSLQKDFEEQDSVRGNKDKSVFEDF